jgi:glycosyltransferase involved in cell wall biosynthesis
MSQPIRVLLVDHAPVFGGVEAMLCDLVAAADRERVQLLLATDPRSPALQRFREAGAEVHAVPLEQLLNQRFAGPRLLRSSVTLARLARREGAAVLHTFTARTHVVGTLAARLANLPMLWRLNDETLPLPLARLLGRVPRKVIAVSRYLAGRYCDLPSPMTVIPDGVPIPAEPAQRAATPTVTLAARLVRWKGQEVFIRAVARAAPYLPKWRAEIVGSASAADERPGLLAGGEAYAQELRALAEELGVQDRIAFRGFRERAELFAGSALAVHTSILPEPFGRTILEAMAAGVPVVGARAGAVPEIVANGITGRLYPAGDAQALAEAMVSLLSDETHRQALGAAGRARAADLFSVERMARHFEAVWLGAAG